MRLYRKARKKKLTRVLKDANLFETKIVGNLMPETIENFASVFADFLKGI